MVRLFLLLFAFVSGWGFTAQSFKYAQTANDLVRTTAALKNSELVKKIDQTEKIDGILNEQRLLGQRNLSNR